MNRYRRAATYSILGLGVALRAALLVALPPHRAHDDHYEPVRVILDEGRLPDAADCWECYQPPLYYVLGAAGCAVTESLAEARGAAPETVEHTGRRTLQLLSLLAGCATLVVCLAIFRQFPELAPYEPLALGLLALLPRHIYMSAMATNDALAYLLASLAVLVTLRAQCQDWPKRACLAAGALAGATALTKGYGWMTVFAIAASLWLFTRHRRTGQTRSPLRRELSGPLLLFLGAALAVGIWPHVRNVWTFGRPVVDNFELRDSPMRFQPPGRVAAVDGASFRLPALFAHPWLHVTHSNSLWTQLYARLWFDYEGFEITLPTYAPWERLWARAAAEHPVWNPQRWLILLDYEPDEVPPAFARVARVGYLAGLPLTLGVLAGWVLALARRRASFGYILLACHLALATAIPVVQTLRLPHFAAMKSAFALGALSSAAVLGALLLALSGPLWVRRGLIVVAVCALGLLAGADLAFVALRLVLGEAVP